MSKSSTKTQLQQWLEENPSISLTAVARSTTYSVGAISSWMNDKYDGDDAKVEDAVRNFLQRQSERKATPKEPIPFVTTRNSRRIFEVGRICHLDGEIGVITGGAGLGKTEAVKAYAKKNSDVILIEADLGHTAKVFFAELHQRCGYNGLGTIHDMFEDVVEKLRGSGRLIIIDEAEHLPYRCLDLVRRIYDKAGIGILLTGMPRLIENLRGRRMQYAQLFSRVGLAVQLEALEAEDVRNIIAAAIPNNNGIWKEFQDASKGNARILSKLIQNSKRISKINKTHISPEIVKETAKMLLI